MGKSGEPRFGFTLKAIGSLKAIKAVNQVMADLRVEKPPDKTFIGRRSRGFDFLGYWFLLQGFGGCPEDGDEVFGEGFPALRAGCVGWAHRGIFGAVVSVGEGWS
ncbi:hypothetical protein NG791_26880 [Laspinema sp. D1]|uniref:hypothetical protein n=1 Tax=Laspinema palackyanum TaxID=3231601 RepID=UPI0034981772|nr:hypothetical protein [Laspinema sp. D2b]